MTKYLLLLLLLVAIGCVACTQAPVQPLAQPTVQPLAQPLPKPAHVVIVIEENKNYEDIIDSANAPYINQLAKMGASLNIYAFHHPSQPNYFELFAGTHTLDIGGKQYRVIDDNCAPGRSTTPSLGGLLGKNFLGYGEDWDPAEPFACPLEGTYYARKHLPWTGFEDSIDASRTFTDFKTLSSFDQLPLVSIVIPNLIHDMHSMPNKGPGEGSKKDIPTMVKNGDTWLQQNLDAYVQWAMKNNSLLIVTWDENSRNTGEEGHDNGKGFEPPKNHIPTILVGQMVKPGSTSPEIYNHYDLLRTIEDMYGLRPYLGGSATARDITDVWQ